MQVKCLFLEDTWANKKKRKMKKITLLLFVIFIVSIGFLLTLSKEKTMKINAPLSQTPFIELIDSIDKKVVDLTSPFDLLEIAEFKQISAYSVKYLPDAKFLLSDNSKSNQKKQIVIYSMQTLPKKLYFNFLSYCTTLYNEEKITENHISCVILPGDNWNNKIVLNFYSTNLRRSPSKR